jgi:DNA (cytosine-5)-methyltransferase 1
LESLLKALSLFTGAGGMDVGVLNAGFSVVAASEMDKHACNTYAQNHPSVELFRGDIADHFDEICAFTGIDLVVGPPCQGFSVAGKMDADDPRSKLVFTFCDVVEQVKPKAFIMENVKSLGSLTKFQKVREELVRRMEASGYCVTMHILNAKEFGVPQSRERVFFTGVLRGIKKVSPAFFDRYKKPAPSLREAIGYLDRAGSLTNSQITKAKITLAAKPILRKSPYAGMLFNGQGRPLNPDAWSSTLPASMGGNRTPIIDEDHLYDGEKSWVEEYHAQIMKGVESEFKEAPKRLRRLTVKEAALLQSFPPDYVFTGPQSRVFSQIGNAVPCDLAFVVASVIRQVLTEKTSNSPSEKSNYELDLA